MGIEVADTSKGSGKHETFLQAPSSGPYETQGDAYCAAYDYQHQVLTDQGWEYDPRQGEISPHPMNYGESRSYRIIYRKPVRNGRPDQYVYRASMISLYRFETGRYELTFYIG